MYSIHIYLFIYSDSLIFGKMYDKETYFRLNIIIFILHAKRFIYSLCLKKSCPLPCLINQKSSDPSLSISYFFMTPLPYLFVGPLEMNNDRSLNRSADGSTKHLFWNFNIYFISIPIWTSEVLLH